MLKDVHIFPYIFKLGTRPVYVSELRITLFFKIPVSPFKLTQECELYRLVDKIGNCII